MTKTIEEMVCESMVSESDSIIGDYQENSGAEESTNGESVTEGSADADELAATMAAKETKQVAAAKCVALAVLLAFAGVSAYITFSYTQRETQAEFESEFNSLSQEILGVSKDNALSTFGTLRSLSNTLTSFSSYEDLDWPFVSIPDFHHRSDDFLTISGADMVAFSPLVSPREVEEWVNYSSENQGWIQEGLLSANGGLADASTTTTSIREMIWKNSGGTANPIPDFTAKSSLPLWQMYPAPTDTSVVNYNLRSNGNFERSIALSESTEKAVLSEIMQRKELSVIDPNLNFDIPRSLVVQPVFESFEPQASVAGFLLVVIPWNIFFEQVLGEGASPIMCVMRSSCGGIFSYLVDGPEAKFLGNQDMHNPKFESMKAHTLFPEFKSGTFIDESVTQYCEYSLSIYPTVEFENEYPDDSAFFNMAAVLSIFLLTSMMFLLYDHMVQQLKRKVVKQAQRSNAIVDSLFPAEVQDRLYRAAEEEKKSVSFHPKYKLQNYLSDSDGKKAEGKSSDGRAGLLPGLAYRTKPIADLFLECTVMFSDISGFTAWSSVREPSQVFALLESIYNSFDALARKAKVFKVETIGDCYVAVCGLPEPNADHAAVMGRFAHNCLVCMRGLMHQLERSLGPDTGELAMRFGLHSGPVTAGVLRGEKSRFQLFGDTVNTTARMESSGERNRIHISESTANFLIDCGKGHWVKKRKDKIAIKGKGEMQTYWLRPKIASGASERGEEETESESNTEGSVPTPTLSHTIHNKELMSRKEVHAKTQRLVDWMSNMFIPLLEQVVAQREASRVVNPSVAKPSKLDQIAAREGTDSTALEEVQEIITLPKFDARVAEQQASSHVKVELSNAVKEQLTSLVTSLATLYHETNPFHNFEHASHVTMSVGKLLSRIVAPEVEALTDEYNSLVHDHTYGITSDPLTQFAVVFSALIHDVDHPGVPNAALVKEGAPVAVHYNNKSVAEQNSVDIAWNLLMEERYQDLRDCIYQSEAELKRFRQLVVNSVMATDIVDKELGALRKARWAKAFSETEMSSDNDVNRKATIVIEHLIQASDVSHTMQHWQVYIRWNERFFQECYQAYLDGRAETDPSIGWYKGEIGFFDFYIIPLAKKLKDCGVFGVSSDEYLNYATQNREEWERRGQEVVELFKSKVTKKAPDGEEEVVSQ